MSTTSFFDQLLKTGASVLADAKQGAQQVRASGDFDKYATGAAVGGVLGLLLGTRRGRALGGSALKLGSVAAVGALAWKAYQDYQASQRAAAPAGAAGAPGSAGAAAPRFEALPAPQQEQRSQAMLRALVAAARSDGHLDEREQALLQAELQRSGADPTLRQWLEQELQRPVDVAAVAAPASTPELAAEIYLASAMVVDETNADERAYLDRLAQALRLAPGLQATLEARARGS